MLLWTALTGIAFTAVPAHAQLAHFASGSPTLHREGGEILLIASVSYAERPAAVGWEIDLPAGWVLAACTGPNLPDVRPPDGSTGRLEFAYTTLPEAVAVFELRVRYPSGGEPATLAAEVHLRGRGALSTLRPRAIILPRS